jgi:hypothetical protein
MTLEQFQASLNHSTPPTSLAPLLAALWWDAKGRWDQAHEIAQTEGDTRHSLEAAWVHAYLHRKEGDSSNAAYWYGRARQPIPVVSLQEEWQRIATALLDEPLPD